jgi:hypothetical protein
LLVAVSTGCIFVVAVLLGIAVYCIRRKEHKEKIKEPANKFFTTMCMMPKPNFVHPIHSLHQRQGKSIELQPIDDMTITDGKK